MVAHAFVLAFSLLTVGPAAAQPTGTLVILVRDDRAPVVQAEVRVGEVTAVSDATGRAVLTLPAGEVEVVVGRFGYETATVRARVEAGREATMTVTLRAEAVVSEEVIVTATRTERRVQDAPLRVEVVDHEEVDEKLLMTPGDVAMLFNETNGLRVQVTSPSLGAANVRVQGLRGRYTQILADGLPLYGGQTGSIGLLQIPPMDLGQLEVIKGVASALYGASALGGVINLVSRVPRAGETEREILLNRTSRGGTDAVFWYAGPAAGGWSTSLLGGAHWQERRDLDEDGWTDMAGYQRVLARPRFSWESGTGRTVFLTAGVMGESRKGGTLADRVAPDGDPFREDLSTRRVDAGLMARATTGGGKLVTIRASGVQQWHDHRFGAVRERDRHHTWFAETAVNGATGPHMWVAGAALQRDGYAGRDLRQFDYAYTVPGVFVQDEYTSVPWATLSASGRLDAHNEFGAFFNPRVSLLLRRSKRLTVRLSGGTGYFAPTPFTEETEAAGLARLEPLGALEPERARSVSGDVTWTGEGVELTATLFRSTIDDAIALREVAEAGVGRVFRLAVPRVEIVNVPGSTRTLGSELIARVRRGPVLIVATHMYVWATEPDPLTGIPREVPLTPRHTAGMDLVWEAEGRGRVGFEVFYTGRQALDENPYRQRSESYWLWGVLLDWRIRRARVFLNTENLSNVRQTRFDPLVRPTRAPDGRWTVDAWAPLDGLVINGGVRLSF